MTKAITTSIAKGKNWQAAQTSGPTSNLDLYLARPTAHFPPQCPGEHMGGGAPPSANEAVEIAPSSTSVASIERTIFFIGSILRGISLTIFFSREEIRSVEKRDGKLLLVGLPTD